MSDGASGSDADRSRKPAADTAVVALRGGRTLGPSVLIHAIAAGLGLATLLLVAQPIFANDTWIHLALGRAFAASGPWLEVDPHLFTAPGPPSPSSWLGAVALYGIQAQLGFTALRIFHGLLVGGILACAWMTLYRISDSRWVASAGLVVFVLLSTYRLVQLRPELFSIAATILVVLLLVGHRRPPSKGEVAFAVALGLVWANTHAAFLLGPLLILAAGASLQLFGLVAIREGDSRDRVRGNRLVVAGALVAVATVLNPQGWSAHWAYFAAGGETLSLGAVSDEWRPTNLFALPRPRLPPTWGGWIACWLSLVGLVFAGHRCFREARAATPPDQRKVDPAMLAIAAAGLAAAIFASRFLWLGLFALAVGGALSAHAGRPRSTRFRWGLQGVLAISLVGLSGLHFQAGDWPLVSRSLRADLDHYRAPYYAGRFNAHAIWFLADSGVEGRIFNPYTLGGFMSFWLHPRLEMSSSGTLNVRREAMETNLAIAARVSQRPDEDYAALLDRQGIDLFLGTGLPIEAIPARRAPSTVHHLEGEAGWLLVFRSFRSAVYLRLNARNRANLERVADYYARHGVPFDRARGFDVERAIAEAPEWAHAHGLVPVDFEALLRIARVQRAASTSVDSSARPVASAELDALRRLALVLATLGLYERALEVDRLVERAPRGGTFGLVQRSVWSLLRLRRDAEALRWTRRAVATWGRESLGGWPRRVEAVTAASERERPSAMALLPLFHSTAAPRVQAGMSAPPARVVVADSPRARSHPLEP